MRAGTQESFLRNLLSYCPTVHLTSVISKNANRLQRYNIKNCESCATMHNDAQRGFIVLSLTYFKGEGNGFDNIFDDSKNNTLYRKISVEFSK